MPKRVKLMALAAACAAGAVLSVSAPVGGRAADSTTAQATTTTTTTTTTTPALGTTVVTTTTVQQTTTRIVSLPTATTTAPSSSNGTPAWVWVLLGILAVGLIALIALLSRRGGGTVSPDDRRRQLDAAVGGWIAQGWAIENQTADSAVLRRASEAMFVSVDRDGHVTTRPIAGG